MASPHASQIPVFWGHGTSDPLVLYKFGMASVDFLTNTIGFTRTTGSTTGLDFRAYEGMAHSSCPEELSDLKEWIKRIVPKDSE